MVVSLGCKTKFSLILQHKAQTLHRCFEQPTNHLFSFSTLNFAIETYQKQKTYSQLPVKH